MLIHQKDKELSDNNLYELFNYFHNIKKYNIFLIGEKFGQKGKKLVIILENKNLMWLFYLILILYHWVCYY